MRQKWNIQIGLLTFLLALFITVSSVNSIVFAAETETSQPTETETEGATTEQTEGNVEETIPEEHIFLQWNLDSNLTYRLDEDNYAWTVYDANGNELTNGSGVPASAGYKLTGYGDWFGSAVVTLTITNNLTEEAQLRLLFMNDLSEAALEISSTLESENDNVVYDPESGELTVAPGAEGVVTLTITADVLQRVNATISEDNTIAGWIQVQVLSPVKTVEAASEEITEETEDETTEDTDEGMTEASTEETTEETTEASTEETTEETTEASTEETTEETTEASTEETTEETTDVTTEETTEETTMETTEATIEETISEDGLVG